MNAPLSLSPMLLARRPEPFDAGRWPFEPKWDGWRCVAVARGGRGLLHSRNGNDLTRRFPTVTADLPAGTVLGCELVVLDRGGCPDFAALMRRQGAPYLLAFDLPALAGRNLAPSPSKVERSGCAT